MQSKAQGWKSVVVAVVVGSSSPVSSLPPRDSRQLDGFRFPEALLCTLKAPALGELQSRGHRAGRKPPCGCCRTYFDCHVYAKTVEISLRSRLRSPLRVLQCSSVSGGQSRHLQ